MNDLTFYQVEKNMILILTNVLNRRCAPTRPNKICITGLRHVINALKISRVSAYHLCSTNDINSQRRSLFKRSINIKKASKILNEKFD